jgi:hypothetical protein
MSEVPVGLMDVRSAKVHDHHTTNVAFGLRRPEIDLRGSQ